jgi:hypothetical protein
VNTSSDLVLWLIVWAAAASAVLYSRLKRTSVGTGLVPVYVFNLWLIHWVAVCLYLIPGYEYYNVDVVRSGFEQSTYGIVAFALGSLVVTPFLMKLRPVRENREVSYEVHEKLPAAYIAVGAVSYLLLSSFLGRVPTASALVGVGQQLFIIGLCLWFWMAWWKQDIKRWIMCGAITLLLPFITIVSRGFIGYGAMAVMTVLAFVVSFTRVSAKVLVAVLLLGYVGLSFYVSYMRDRGEIRGVVWGGEPLQGRVTRVYETINTLEWFDLSNESHLTRIDERLNQNFLVGSAVEWLSLTNDYAHGETVWQALVAFVPRAIWPEKPVVAGSGDLVSEHTGIRFAEGTSVGIGHLMEFYINFGTGGVVFGFLIMGVILTIIDLNAAQKLLQDDWQKFALWYLTGISFLQVGGSLVEVTSSAAASVVVALLVNNALLYNFQRKRAVPTHATGSMDMTLTASPDEFLNFHNDPFRS